MGEGIAAVLPMAVGTAISPVPIIAVILMLFSARARVNGPVFAVAWFLGLLVVSGIAYTLADSQDAATDSGTSDVIYTIKLLLGVLLLFVALKQWRSRPKEGAIPDPPKWFAMIDQMTAIKAAGISLLLAGINPKNLALSISAGSTVAQRVDGSGSGWGTLVVYALLGSLTVAGPVVYYFVAGESAKTNLNHLKDWLSVHNAVVMMILLAVFGTVLLSDGLQGLLA